MAEYALAYAVSTEALVGTDVHTSEMVIYRLGRRYPTGVALPPVPRMHEVVGLVGFHLGRRFGGAEVVRLAELPRDLRHALCREHLPKWVYG